MFDPKMTIAQSDPELWAAMEAEYARQEHNIELIASENYASPAVMEAQGSVLTNKYAEGYPGKRYYGGCEHVDVAEQLAIDRLKSLFGAEYANVQPHSGSQANAGVYMAMLQPGDTILGMSLAHGGHLTHGSSVNFSGKIYKGVAYGLDPETEAIDYAQVEALAKEHKPKMIVAGASAYALHIDFKRFREIADSVGACQGRRLQGSRDTGIQGLPAAGAEECPGDGRNARRAWRAHRFGPYPVPPVPRRSACQEHHWQGRRSSAGPCTHHGQQEFHPKRPAKAVRDQWHSYRQPCYDDPRL